MQYNKQEKKIQPGLYRWLNSEFTQQDGRKKRTANRLCDKRDRAITYMLCHDAHLTLTFSGL